MFPYCVRTTYAHFAKSGHIIYGTCYQFIDVCGLSNKVCSE